MSARSAAKAAKKALSRAVDEAWHEGADYGERAAASILRREAAHQAEVPKPSMPLDVAYRATGKDRPGVLRLAGIDISDVADTVELRCHGGEFVEVTVRFPMCRVEGA